MSTLTKIDVRASSRALALGTHEGLRRPTRAEAEEAVSLLIRWAGDDPGREGLKDTPARVVRAYEQWFAGYGEDPGEHLTRTFEEVDGYDEMVVMRDIGFVSHCEHHMAPITGRAHVGYLPHNKVVGISKLARLVQAHARRLQIQERLTAAIANTLDSVLGPRGVAVVIEADHGCVRSRGIRETAAALVTSRMLGAFRDRPETRQEFLSLIGVHGSARSGNLSL